MPDFEYYEGLKVIQHEDGSTTYIETTHEPYVEPLSSKQQWAIIGGFTAACVGVCALPVIVDRMEEWYQNRKEIRKIRQQQKIEKLKTEPVE